MEQTHDTKSYDLFKLIVAILLVIIIIILLLNFPGGNNASTQSETAIPSPTESSTEGNNTQEPPTPTEVPEGDKDSSDELELPPFPEPSGDLVYDETTRRLYINADNPLYELSEDNTRWIPVIPKDILDQIPTAEPVFTDDDLWILNGENNDIAYAWEYATHAWIANQNEQAEDLPETVYVDCPGAMPPHLEVGDKVRVTTNLNFRSSPKLLEENWILTNIFGTTLTVLEGSVCTAYDYGAYLWWKVQKENGDIGWSAEGSATGAFYFLEPIE